MTRNPAWLRLSRATPPGLRYVAVGAFCAVLNNILLIGVVDAGVDYLRALCLVCLPMLIIGFALHVTITFETKPTLAAFFRYSVGILANYPLWIASLFLLCDVARLPILLASPIATLFLFVWNYLATHWAIPRSFHSAWPWSLRLREGRRP
jgi:putative flippase GtrA